MMSRRGLILLVAGLAVLAGIGILAWYWTSKISASRFDGARAYQDVIAQTSFGARVVGTKAHAECVQYIQTELAKSGWQSQIQQSTVMGHEVQNIVAIRGDEEPRIIIGAHYDSRMFADQDPNPANRQKPVPGADDGASGVAVMLELARSLPVTNPSPELVFFDAEDNGNIPGWDWSLGATSFAQSLTYTPDAVIVLDMIGDSNLQIYQEGFSTPWLVDQIWGQAKTLGYDSYFIPQRKYNIIDDHIPFIKKGISAVDVIDIDYPYWHTISDTADKVSEKSLQVVGDTMLAWLQSRP